MSHYQVTICLTGPADDIGPRDHIEGILDAIMDDLLDCVVDPTVGESYHDDGTVTLEFSMEVEEDKTEEAVAVAMGALRSSLHGVGASTPGWEDLIAHMRSEVRATSEDEGLVGA